MAATGNIFIDRLLSTVIQLKASDLHIAVGQPPVLRHNGRLRRLDTKSLDNDDTTSLMKSITPDRCQQELQEAGVPFMGKPHIVAKMGGTETWMAFFADTEGNHLALMSEVPSDGETQ